MNKENFCTDCQLKHDCGNVCQRLDDSQCPHFILKIIAAFMLPMVIFIVSLAVFEKILSGGAFLHISQKMLTLIGFLLALLTTVVCMLIVKLGNRLLRNFLRTSKI